MNVFALTAAALCTCLTFGEWQPVARVKDGDSFTLANPGAFGLPVSIRVRGIDTPETGGKARCKAERRAGKAAADFTALTIAESGWRVRLSNVRHDKFGGRYDADVAVLSGAAEQSLAAALIAAGHARPYAGGKRKGWCPSTRSGQAQRG